MATAKIALTGKSGAGKDAVGLILQVAHGFQRYALADGIRHCLTELTGLDVFALPKDQVMRSAMQNVGEAARSLNPDVWVLKMLGRINKELGHGLFGTPVVITDCRYLNEASILSSLGFFIVRVVRPKDIQVGFTDAQKRHASEVEQDKISVDYTLLNDGTLEELDGKTAKLLRVLDENKLA